MSLTVAVTGLNATDNPGPGVPVIRAVRDACPDVRIVGLGYDALDPGAYMREVADDVYLMPYPSQGARTILDRLQAICWQTPIDVVIPCLDAELPAYLKIESELEDLGIRALLPTATGLRLRSKANFHDLGRLGVRVPKGLALTDRAAIARLPEELTFPVMVKGQFYDAYLASTLADVYAWFDRIQGRWGLPVIVQEFVAGTEFDIACVGDGEGGLIGSVPMRKMQLTDKGKAWGGITVADAAIDTFVADTVRALKWRGPCELEVMRSHDTGDIYLIEINPRFPAWIYLSVGAGRNLPWAVVQRALGESVEPMAPAPPGVLFLRHSYDQICTLSDYQSLTTLGELHRMEVCA